VSAIEIFRLSEAPYEAYAGPPGRVDVADVVTTASSRTIAVGFVETEGGPFAYRCDYEAICIPLDDRMTWDTGNGSHRTQPGDVIWIPHGGRASYAAEGTARFVYATHPVNWPEIVGWNAGEDIKDLSMLEDIGELGAVALLALADPALPWMTAQRTSGAPFEHAIVTRPRTGSAMTTMLLRTKEPTGWNLTAGEGLVLVVSGEVRLRGKSDSVGAGDMIWKPGDQPLQIETTGPALCISISGHVDTDDRAASAH